MPKFIVKTHERVEATYEVDALDRKHAESMFGSPRINWDHVEQMEYMAYSLDIESVEQI